MVTPERSFGRYTLLEQIGEGGMGAVYRARDERLGRLVALKVVRAASDPTTTAGAEGTARLMREARAAAALSHPHVVAIYDVTEHEGVPCIAMELVEGPSMRRLIGGDASQSERLVWLRQVAEALRAAHAMGMVHRDIKPDNVVIREGRHAKVLDFGLARGIPGDDAPLSAPAAAAATAAAAASSAVPDLATITHEGRVIGTPAYMAPEQIRGERLDARCDQFAWGVMAYEVLSRNLPWRPGLTSLGLLAAILTDPVPPMTASNVPAGIADVIARAMSRSADDRFSSMGALLRALDLAEGGPALARAGEPSEGGAASVASADTEVAAPPLARNKTTGVPPMRTPAARTAMVEPGPERRGAGGLVLGGLAIAMAAGAIAVAATRWTASRDTVVSSPSASITSARRARTIENEPAPTSTDHGEALALYRRGRMLQRECDWTRAHPLFEKAAALAPQLGEAHFQVAVGRWITINGFGVDAVAREAYARAVDERPRMSERDRAMVEAHEPILARDPPDWPAAIAAMKRLAEARPDDAEIRLRYSTLRGVSGDYDIESEVTAACELDPEYADAWQMRMYVEVAADRPDAAAAAAAECHRIAPNSKECAWTATAIYAFIGRCVDAEREAKRSAGNDIAQAHGTLLLGLGRPRPDVEKAFELGWSTAPALRTQWEPLDRWSIAMADGDFDQARALSRRLLEASRTGSSKNEAFHWAALSTLAVAAHETGTLAAEEPLLREEMQRQKEWEGDAPFYKNTSLTVWSYLRRNGLATAAEVSTAREAYRARYAGVLDKHPTLVWAIDCQTAETAEEARAAVDRQPETLRPGALVNNQEGRGFIGAALWKAGETDRALPWLRQAASSCLAWSAAHPYVDAHRYLGEALETRGEKDEACRAYEFVLDHWGRARPRSVTAEVVRKRARALGCAKPTKPAPGAPR